MANIVVGVLGGLAEAQRALSELIQSGIPSERISYTADEQSHQSSGGGLISSTLSAAGGLALGAAKTAVGMLGALAQMHTESLQRGGILFAVETEGPSQAMQTTEILKRHGAKDITQTAYGYTGPERRMNSIPWRAPERRRAA